MKWLENNKKAIAIVMAFLMVGFVINKKYNSFIGKKIKDDIDLKNARNWINDLENRNSKDDRYVLIAAQIYASMNKGFFNTNYDFGNVFGLLRRLQPDELVKVYAFFGIQESRVGRGSLIFETFKGDLGTWFTRVLSASELERVRVLFNKTNIRF